MEKLPGQGEKERRGLGGFGLFFRQRSVDRALVHLDCKTPFARSSLPSFERFASDFGAHVVIEEAAPFRQIRDNALGAL